MVRISKDMLEAAGQFTNAVKDREIDLRGTYIVLLAEAD